MTKKWLEAANQYKAAREMGREAQVKDKQDNGKTIAMLRQEREDVLVAAAELEQFMQNEGLNALELLRQSRCFIRLAEEYDGGGYGVVYVLHGDGLQKSSEAMGTWVAYSQNVKTPSLSSISACEAVEAAVIHGGKKPREVLPFILQELDKIAGAAPQ